MKRLLLAAGLAVGLHGLLFSMEAEWAKKKAIHRLRPEPVSFTLSYKKPKVQALPPAKKLIESKKKSIQVKKKSQRKKARARPSEKVRITQKEREKASKPEKAPKPEKTSKPEKASKPEEAFQSKAPRMSPSHVEPAPVNEREAPEIPSPLPIREAIPVYRKNPSPKYPRVARKRGYQGTVILEVLVNQEGKVEDLRLFRSSGYTVLDRAATASVKNWLFEPGMRGDEKVEMWVKVPVRFRLR